MALENKLGLTSSSELAREEERISKKKALALFVIALRKRRLEIAQRLLLLAVEAFRHLDADPDELIPLAPPV